MSVPSSCTAAARNFNACFEVIASLPATWGVLFAGTRIDEVDGPGGA